MKFLNNSKTTFHKEFCSSLKSIANTTIFCHLANSWTLFI